MRTTVLAVPAGRSKLAARVCFARQAGAARLSAAAEALLDAGARPLDMVDHSELGRTAATVFMVDVPSSFFASTINCHQPFRRRRCPSSMVVISRLVVSVSRYP
jgi:hypothetical protein